MSKTWKVWSVLLSLLLAAQLFSAVSPAACADGDAADTDAVAWTVNARDAGGAERNISDAAELAASLGSGFSLDWGKDAQGGAVSSPTVADLRRSGVKITPPEGYTVSSVFLCAGDSAPLGGSSSLLVLSSAALDGSAAVTLPAKIFAASYSSASVGAVFNGTAGDEGWTLRIALERVDASPAPTLRYTAGSLTALPGLITEKLGAEATLVAGGDTVALSGTLTAADLSDNVKALALSELMQKFDSWRLVCDNGAKASVKPGDPIRLRSSATLEARWKTAVIFRFTAAEKVYDGTPLTASYSRVGDVKSGDTLIVPADAVQASRTEAGESTATLDVSRVSVTRGGADVTGEYAFSVETAALHVIPRSVTFTVSDVSAPYNGEALTPSAYSISSGTLAEGHSATPNYSGRQTLPGNSTGSASFTITDVSGGDVTANYNISVINGSITVTTRTEKQPLTVTLGNVEKEYDGTSDVLVSSVQYSVTGGALLGSDQLSVLSAEGNISAVGEGLVSAAFAVKNGDVDVSNNYEINVAAGKLTVSARPITLTADSASKDYDGQPLTRASFTLTSGSLVTGHEITATVKGSQLTAGSSANVIDPKSVKITDAAGKNVTALYALTLRDGTLTVNGSSSATAITVKMKDAEKVYDGTALTSKDYEISSGALAAGDTLVIGKVTGEQTAVGESSVSAVFTVKRGESDATGFYSITVTPGKLRVKARPITVTAASASKVYDGTPLTRDQYSVTSGSLVKGHKLTATVSGSQTQMGSSANVIAKSSVKITDASNKDVTANYAVTTAAGTLTVNRDPVTSITVSLGDASKVYDGKAYRFLSSDLRVTAGGPLPAGYTMEATFSPESATDAGKYDVTIKSIVIRNASGADVTSQYSITRAKGSLTITQRPLTIETKAANKVYDGTALTERSTPTIIGRVEEHQVTLRITGSQIKVGSSENTVADVKITDKSSGADVTKNYAISYQYGLLTVTDADSTETDTNWVKGSAGTLYIKFDHDYEGFEGLLVDGKELPKDAYTSASGSTDIWLKADYLNTLSAGSHTITAKYASGATAQTVFSVSGNQSTRTADNNHLTLWLVLLLLTLLGAMAAAYLLVWGKKRPAWMNKLLRKGK